MAVGIRMGAVASRAGVPVSTVRYYLDRGLLPEPVRKSRNMAWYSEETVERVKLIKDLQERAFLPLKVIRDLFERTTDPHEIRRHLKSPPGDSTDEATVPAEVFTQDASIPQPQLDRLEALGLLSPATVDGQVVYGRLDAELLQVLARMRSLGLTPQRGYSVDQLALYIEPLERLVRAEVALAWTGLVGRASPVQARGSAKEIMASATDLVSVLHEKLVEKVLGELSDDSRVNP